MKIIIAGAGEVGSHLAKMLSNEANDLTIIDSDQGRLDALSENTDVVTVTGNPSSISVLKEAGVEDADLFIAVNPSTSQDVNIVSAMLAKKLGSKKATARVNYEEYLSYENKYLFTEIGIDLLFYPEKIAAGEIVDLLKRTASSESMDFARGKLQMAVFKLEEDSPMIDMRLIDFVGVATSADLPFRVVAIARNSETIIPSVDTKFKYHDLVFIMSKREGIDQIMKYIGKSNIEVDKLMILGGGPIGEMVARQLTRQVDSIKIIELKKDRCVELSEKLGSSVTVVNGDGRNSDMLLEEGIKNYDAFVAVTSNTETNILACVAAKKLGVSRTIAEVENIEYIRLAEEMGVDAVINKKLITAGRIFKFTLSSKVRFIKYMSGTNAEVLEYIVAPESWITKGKLKDIGFPKNAIIGGVIRGNEAFIAVGDTEIKAYDRVAVFALPQTVKEVDKFFR
ncbi:MAG: Trk system potassium transporter TrkA [Bacteroidetes bacterium]|uniref:Trk system potassium uptake protein TrkA n=1 Tax=Candidatus Cryptobacteroides avicola TaxID=2840757 RepID=A0A940DQX1_9BACT|nr:Trk system potassium transporter TrkA [Candidatus Cryptobacteroides avicola]